jgi:polysaccharide pyruvyl transferase WcaK-like protein
LKVLVFDPALENVNAGDEIISRSIQTLGLPNMENAIRLTTHRPLKLSERRLVSQADYVILGGTNALSSHMERFRQWLIDPDLAFRMRRKLILLGVGWWQYQEEPCRYTRTLFKQVFARDVPQAARDRYTADRLNALGHTTLMTSCPTMWRLPEEQRAVGLSNSVVVTVTDYQRDVPVDRRWLDAVYSRYDNVRLVGMGPLDGAYMFEELNLPRKDWSGFGVDSLDAAVTDADFIGTRLHGGVRALQLGRPSVILACDNRAAEISRTTRLAVVDRRKPDEIMRVLSGEVQKHLQLPLAAISAWTEAFSRAATGDR